MKPEMCIVVFTNNSCRILPSADQGVSCTLWNPDIYCRVLEYQLQDLLVRHMKPPRHPQNLFPKDNITILSLSGSIFEVFYSL